MVDFWVPGKAVGAGSKRALPRRGGGPPIVMDTTGQRGKDWRASVQHAANIEMSGRPLLEGPLILEVRFYILRPKGHHRSGKHANELKPNAPEYPVVTPDATKLVRAIEDAMNGVVWHDDKQVVSQHVYKFYGDKPGARVLVETML